MEKNRKSYMAAMKMEVITEDDKTVKAVRVHGLRTVDDFPVAVICVRSLGDDEDVRSKLTIDRQLTLIAVSVFPCITADFKRQSAHE